MTIFDLTFGKIIYLIEKLTEILISTPYLAKILVYLFSLTLSITIIIFWIKLEIKNRDEVNKINRFIKNRKIFLFYKKRKDIWNQIKNIFSQDKNRGLIEIKKLLDFSLETFGYEGTLQEKINNTNEEIIINKNDLLKAIEIVEAIEKKLSHHQKIDIKDKEYFLILKQFEIALLSLNIISTQDCLALLQE